MARAHEQIRNALTAAAERRHEIHDQMVRGAISVDRHRKLAADECRWIDTLLDELLDAARP